MHFKRWINGLYEVRIRSKLGSNQISDRYLQIFFGLIWGRFGSNFVSLAARKIRSVYRSQVCPKYSNIIRLIGRLFDLPQTSHLLWFQSALEAKYISTSLAQHWASLFAGQKIEEFGIDCFGWKYINNRTKSRIASLFHADHHCGSVAEAQLCVHYLAVLSQRST